MMAANNPPSATLPARPRNALSAIIRNASDGPEPASDPAWQDVEQVLLSHFHKPDIEAVKVFFACVAAHKITDFPMAWLMIVAPPGSLKTALLESLRFLNLNIHYIDEFTGNTFISGKLNDSWLPSLQKASAPASLLHRIGTEGIMVNADFGTVINLNRNVRGSVLAQLRRIYDGRLRREFGTNENLDEREWQGRLTLLVGVTPDVDKHHALFQALGERFLYVRSDRAGGIDAGLKAIGQTTDVQLELQAVVLCFLSPTLDQRPVSAPRIPQEYHNRISALGELVVRARADVPRHRFTRQIEGEAVIESNTRCPQQLMQVARGWAVCSGRSEVNGEDYSLAVRVAFDSVPPIRAKVIKTLSAGREPYTIDAPGAVVNRALEDLEVVKLVSQTTQGKWILCALTCDLLKQARVI